jgi:mevalonate kinase
MKPITLFVPGRLCLFGEHSDWAGGYRRIDPALPPGACIIAGTDQGLEARAEPHESFEMRSHLPDGTWRGPFVLPMEADALRAATEAGGFFSYAAGVAAFVHARHRTPGLRLTVTRMTLPIGRGLSSSAAVCVLTARAFNRVYDLGLTLRDEMEAAYQGETATGSRCGRMDQACAYGKLPVRLVFDGDEMAAQPLQPTKPIHLVIVDLRRGKDTRRILRDLNACFPGTPGDIAANVRRALGPLNLELVGRAATALQAGDPSQLGALMAEAQQHFDELVAPACPELAAPRLHQILQHAAARALAHGGKGVGSQGDGAAQFVARDQESQRRLADRLQREAGLSCLPLTVEPSGTQSLSSQEVA